MKNKKRLFGALVIVILALTMIATLAACGEEETVQYTVTLKSGFDDQVTTQTLNEGEVFTLPASPFTRDGYTFDYWTEEGTTYPNRVGTPIPVYRNMTFVAHWTENYVPDVPEDFTVTVKDGYGSGQITAVVTEGEEYVLPAADTFTRPEYTFGGWQVGDSVLAAGDSVTITANTEIIAVWNAIPKYNVSVLKGYGDNAPIATYVVTSGGSYTLPEMTLDYADHNFLGYADLSGDLTEYIAAGTVIENITSNKTFVAMWEEITYYTVYLKKTADATGTDVDNSNRVAEGGSFVLPECNFVNDGYVFKAWLYDGEEVQPGFTIENVVSDIDVIAVWEEAAEPQPETYSVSFTDGLYTRPGGSYTEGTAYTIPLDSDTYFTKADYKLIGWTVAGDDSGKVYKPGETYNGNANVVFEAVWEQIVYYTVTLSDGAGKNETVGNVESGTVYEYILPAADKFSREGYTFAGWKIGEETYSAGETVNLTVDKNITITAVWEAIPTYTVTYYYELNGTQISVSSAMYSGTEYDLIDYPADQTPPTGMKFDGWKLVGGDETVYPAGTRLTVSGNAGYYAVYRDAVFTVAFYSDNAETASYEIAEGGNAAIPAAPEKTGYTFLGWYLNGEGEALKGEHVYNVTNDMRFEAKWQINSYEITFEIVINNVAISKKTVIVNYGEIPEPELQIPEYQDLNDRQTAYFTGEWDREIVPATESTKYSAIAVVGDRYYTVTFEQNGYVSFKVNDEIVSESKVKYGESLSFELVRANGVYIDDVTVIGSGEELTASNGIYTLPFSKSSTVAVTGWSLAEYDIDVSSVSNAVYTLPEVIFNYGDIVILKAKGVENYDVEAPVVKFNGEVVAATSEPDEDGYYEYELTMVKNSVVSISGVKDMSKVIYVTFVDLFGNEETIEWSPADGPVESNVPYSIRGDKIIGTTQYLEYCCGYSGVTIDGVNYYPFLALTDKLDDPDNFFASLVREEEELQKIIDPSSPEFTLQEPRLGEENKYYLLYSVGNSFSLKFSMPSADMKIEYWCDIYGEWMPIFRVNSLVEDGYLKHTVMPARQDGDSIYTQFFNPGDAVYVRFVDENGDPITDIDAPELWDIYDKNKTTQYIERTIDIGNGQTENAVCYEFVIDYVNTVYDFDRVPPEKVIIYDNITNYSIVVNGYISIFDVYFDGYRIPAEGESINKNQDIELEISYQLSTLDTKAMFMVGENGKIVFTKDPLNIRGQYDSVSYEVINDNWGEPILYIDDEGNVMPVLNSLGWCESYIKIKVIIHNIQSDIELYGEVYYVEKEYTTNFVLSDDYDIYVDGIKLIDDDGDGKVQVTFTEFSPIEVRVKEGINANLINPSSGTPTTFNFTYINWKGEKDTYTASSSGYNDMEFMNDRAITYLVGQYVSSTILSFEADDTAWFDNILIGYPAEHVDDKCITGEALSNVTLPDGAPNYLSYDNGFQIRVRAPKGDVPVLYIENSNILSDSFRPYYTDVVEADSSYNIYTFTVTGIDCDIRWYVRTVKEVYNVTFNFAGNSITIPIEHGTMLSDVEGIPTYYVIDDGASQTFYLIEAWNTSSALDGNEVSMIDGSALQLYAAGAETDYTLSFTSDSGDTIYYQSLAAALEDIGTEAVGTIDMFYGKTDTSLANGTYTIPANVTLRLPYGIGLYGRELGTTANASIFYASDDKGMLSLVIGEGATLEVYGSISIGGIVGYPQSARPYQGQTSGAHAIMEVNGAVIVKAGGRIYANGYIKGNDNGSLTLESGAESYLPFVVKDYLGGTNTSRIYSEGYAPFNIYEIPNVQLSYTINYGATEYVYAMLYALSQFNEVIVEVIGDEGMLRLSDADGYIVKHTREITNPRNNSGADTSLEPAKEFRTTIDVFGGGSDGVMKMNLFGSIAITTHGVRMGIPYTYERITLHDGDYTIYNSYKIMPGATFEVAEDASLTIIEAVVDDIVYRGSIAVYAEDFKVESDQLNGYRQLTYPEQPNGITESGRFVLNGKLVIYGSFGGDIEVGEILSETAAPTIIVKTLIDDQLTQKVSEAVYLGDNDLDITYSATISTMAVNNDGSTTKIAANSTFTYINGIWSK